MDREQLRRRAEFVVSVPRVIARALVRYDWQFLEIGKRFFMAFRERFLPEEAFEKGLLNPRTPEGAAQSSVSRSQMVEIQRRLNPMEWEPLLYDKGIFYRHCLAEHVPVPRLYALYFRTVAGWTAGGRCPENACAWEEFLLRECPAEFVVKPCRSEYGAGIMVVRREGDAFIDQMGTVMEAGALIRRLAEDQEFSSFVIQERIHNHPTLAHLASGEGVHSFRMVTYTDSAGEATVVAADMKLIVGKNIVSNLAHGFNRNLIADIDRTTGTIKSALEVNTSHGGYRAVSRHPDSNIALEGFPIPHWEAIMDLAIRGASVFRPVRTIGWDIALSDRGPLIMEGNIWYDPSLAVFLSDYWAVGFK